MSAPEPSAAVARFDFRRLSPHLRLGTASDRYAGWMDQVYPRDVWAGEVATRKKKVGAQSVEERMLPVESVEDYFLHFGVLELDFPFYRPLLEADGKPTSGLMTLKRYAEAAPATARFLLKAPQAFAARILPVRAGGTLQFAPNPEHLDAMGFNERFLAPARDALGTRLAGVVFEQEYARVRESPAPEAFVDELDAFFARVPNVVPIHLEIRSAHLLTPLYFRWLEERGLGFVFSHWQWLPPLKEQWRLAGDRLIPSGGEAVVRLMGPRDMAHEKAFAAAYPFDAASPELAEHAGAAAMVGGAVALAVHAARAGVVLNVVCNNLAWGNAPLLAQAVAERYLRFTAERE